MFIVDAEHERPVFFQCDSAPLGSIGFFELDRSGYTNSALACSSVYNRKLLERSGDNDPLFVLVIDHDDAMNTHHILVAVLDP